MSAALELAEKMNGRVRRSELIAAGRASFIGRHDPYSSVRIYRALPAGTSLESALRIAGMEVPWDSCGLFVVLNGKVIPADQWATTYVAAGDRVRAYNMPRFFAALLPLLLTLAENALLVVGTSAIGLGVGSIGGTILAYGIALTAYVAIYAAVSYVASLIVGAIVGTPDQQQLSSSNTKAASPTAGNAPNQIYQDAPVWDVFGKIRVTPPHAALPNVSFFGDTPTQRMLLMWSTGDSVVSDIKLGNTPLERFASQVKNYANVQSVDFPVTEQLHPGILIEDNYTPNGGPWYSYALTKKTKFVRMDFEIPNGFFRVTKSGKKTTHSCELEIQFRVVGASTWSDWVAGGVKLTGDEFVFLSNLPYTSVTPRTTVKISTKGDIKLDAKIKKSGRPAGAVVPSPPTSSFKAEFSYSQGGGEQIFFSIQRAVPIGIYEFQIRTVSTEVQNDYTYERGGKGAVPVALQTDFRWQTITAELDATAIKNFVPGFTGTDLSITNDILNGEGGNHVNGIVEKKRPILLSNARTTPGVTRNHSEIALDVLSGALAGSYKVVDAEIDFASWQAFKNYCDETVTAIDGTTEPRHRCDGVMDVDGKSILAVAHDVVSSARGKLDKVDGKWRVIIDRLHTTPDMILSDADVISISSKIRWTDVPDAFRVEFLNDAKNYERDERMVYNDTFARWSALESSVSITINRSGNRATFTRGSGTWEAFPYEGWLKVTIGGLYGGYKWFLIHANSDLTTLSVIDPDGTLTGGFTGTGTFETVIAARIEKLSLPYTTRSSEIWREGRHLLAQAARNAQHEIEVDWDWLLVTRGDMVEVSSDVLAVGKGRGRILGFAGTLTACTGLLVDDIYDLAGASVPGVRIRSRVGSSITVTQRNIDISATNNKRATPPVDDGWLMFTSPLNLTSLNIKTGSDVGSLITWGEIGSITLEVIVDKISKGNDFTAVLVCHDHAPEIFSNIDIRPIPPHSSGVANPGAADGVAPPATPVIPFQDDQVQTYRLQLNASAPSGGIQTLTRTDAGSFIDEGFLVNQRAFTQGFQDAGNNVTDAHISEVNALTIKIANASGVARTGNGDQRLFAGKRSKLGSPIHADAAATYLTSISVTKSGGSALLDGPSGEKAFLNFRAAGFVACDEGFSPGNRGVFPITAVRNGGDGITITNAAAEDQSAGGFERVVQTQFYAPTGVNFGIGNAFGSKFAIGDRVHPVGFTEPSMSDQHFGIRAMTDVCLFVDDPGYAMRSDVGNGDEQIRGVEAAVTYRVQRDTSGGVQLYACLKPTKGTGPGSVADEFEADFRVIDPTTGFPLQQSWSRIGAVPASEATLFIGPIGFDQDFEVRVRARNRANGLYSGYANLCGDGLRGRPPAPTGLKVEPNPVRVAEGTVISLKVSWTPQ